MVWRTTRETGDCGLLVAYKSCPPTASGNHFTQQSTFTLSNIPQHPEIIHYEVVYRYRNAIHLTRCCRDKVLLPERWRRDPKR